MSFFFFLQEDIFPYLKIAEVLMDIWAKTCLLLKQERLQCFAFSHNQLSQFWQDLKLLLNYHLKFQP